MQRLPELAHCVLPENTSETAFQSIGTTVSSTVSSVRSERSRRLPVRQPAKRAESAQRLQPALLVATAALADTVVLLVFQSLAAKDRTALALGSVSRALPATNVLVAPTKSRALPEATKTKRVRRTAFLAQLVFFKRPAVRPPVLTARGATSVRLVAPAR